jgi:ribosomal protein L19E
MRYEDDITKYYYPQILDWINSKERKHSQIAFTSGLGRNIARLIETAEAKTISKTRADGLSFGKETSRKENRDLWDSLRECEGELKQLKDQAPITPAKYNEIMKYLKNQEGWVSADEFNKRIYNAEQRARHLAMKEVFAEIENLQGLEKDSMGALQYLLIPLDEWKNLKKHFGVDDDG